MATKRSAKSLLECHPLTLDRWADFETLFGPRGACGGCWCMCWRLKRAEFQSNKGAGNKASMHALVDAGEAPGILGYLGREPVGWCAVAPRPDYPALARSRILRPVDETPVWSISCLLVRKDIRRQGLSVRLLEEAAKFARKRGAKVVEGYPLEPSTETIPAVFAWTGLAAAFRQAGFRECARRSPTRPIMRLDLS
jgi:GNAT superfamily N-acetyltransferase